jgi:hypothetical protein
MIIVVNYLEPGVEAFVSRQLIKAFGDHKLVATDETLPGKISVDFHFKNKAGTNIFVEVTTNKIGRGSLSKILNLYSSLSNLEPPLEKFELIVVGPEFEASAKKALNGLPVRLVTFEELGIARAELEAVREEQKHFQDRRLSPEEAKLVAM